MCSRLAIFRSCRSTAAARSRITGPGSLSSIPCSTYDARDSALENAVIALVAEWNIAALGRRDAPGIYVEGRKLASIGLRIRRACSYHGMAFNIAMDLEPFRRINPCGYRGLEVTDLRTLGITTDVRSVADQLAPHLLRTLGMPTELEWA
jgi:lipoyl(octanoyl) transferase